MLDQSEDTMADTLAEIQALPELKIPTFAEFFHPHGRVAYTEVDPTVAEAIALLQKARDYIASHGATQRSWGEAGKEVCPMGALYLTSGRNITGGSKGGGSYGPAVPWELPLQSAVAAMGEAVPNPRIAGSGSASVMHWHDGTPGTSQQKTERAVALFDRAIAHLEAA